MQTRKQFLKTAGAVTAGMSLLPLSRFYQVSLAPAPVYFDLHCHPGLSATSDVAGLDPAKLNKTVDEMNRGHLTGGLFALVADAGLIKLTPTGVVVTGKYSPGEGWKEYKRQLEDQRNAFAKVPAKLSANIPDLNAENKMPVGFTAVEGGHFLEGQIKYVEEAYQDGVRSIQLVHYAPNDIGDLQTSEAIFNGLSVFGKDVVKKMNGLGMAIDVAHATYETTKDVANLTNAPIILSHSILQMEADRPIAKRAISKEHAKVVAGTGGIIGAWPSGFNKNFDEYVDNIKRLVDVAGIDHVGIGTDMDGNFKPVLSSYTQFPLLENALVSKGFSSGETGKIMGENARAVLSKIFNNK